MTLLPIGIVDTLVSLDHASARCESLQLCDFAYRTLRDMSESRDFRPGARHPRGSSVRRSRVGHLE